MVITFCGHAEFYKEKEYEEKVMSLLEEIARDECVDIYLGGYGGFDAFAYTCCKKYQSVHLGVRLIFVTPYITINYQHNRLAREEKIYDDIIYPEIEDRPLRYAIIYRNRWMIDRADFVISYVEHAWGGAYKSYKYARQRGKKIFNLSEKGIT